MSDFDRTMKFVRTWEGGKVDDKRDPGGRTAYGVTQRVFHDYLRDLGKPPRDVFTIRPHEIDAIYRARYWDVVTPGRVWPLNAVLMDAAVNCGPGRALRWLEQAKADTPPATPDRMTVLALKVMKTREAYYRRIGEDPASPLHWAYEGWLNRWAALMRLIGFDPKA